MKTQIFPLAAAAVVSSFLLMGNAGQAQTTNTATRAERRGPTLQQRMDRITTELKLSDDQSTKVKDLLQKQAKERRELVRDTNLSREDRREKMRALMQEERKQLKTILNSEQFEKWQELQKQMRTRRPGTPGQAGGSAPAPAPEPANPVKTP